MARVKTNVLNDRQKEIVATMRMRLTTEKALLYLREAGYELSAMTWRREKKKLNDSKLERLHFIAKIGFEDQHLERIDQLELIQRLMWDEYDKEESPYKRASILEKIADIQPYLSNYYDLTREVIAPRDIESRQSSKENIIPEYSA